MGKNTELSCEIVRDLLPTYAEGLTSDVTSRAVEEHLSGCEECSQIFAGMKSDMSGSLPKPDEKKHINFLKRLHGRTVRVVLTTFTVIALLFGVFMYASLTGVGVKKDDLDIAYTVSEGLDGDKTVTHYYIDIRLKSSGALALSYVDDNLANNEGHMKFVYEARRVLPNKRYEKILYAKDEDEKNMVKHDILGFSPDDESFNPDDTIEIRCSDGVYTITVADIIANAVHE